MVALRQAVGRVLNTGLARVGYRIARAGAVPDDIAADTEFAELYSTCWPYTMTSVERMYALYGAVQYIVEAHVSGAIVECGVWRGGSSMVAALALMRAGDRRDIYLYDTFQGMTEPGGCDV